MMKQRKSGNLAPLFMVNVLPRANFEEIYQIRQIRYISVKIEAFNSRQRVKQCYRCQGFGHASEECNCTPKCVKCSEQHLTTACPHKGRITLNVPVVVFSMLPPALNIHIDLRTEARQTKIKKRYTDYHGNPTINRNFQGF